MHGWLVLAWLVLAWLVLAWLVLAWLVLARLVLAWLGRLEAHHSEPSTCTASGQIARPHSGPLLPSCHILVVFLLPLCTWAAAVMLWLLSFT
jgi:hypothetical protein